MTECEIDSDVPMPSPLPLGRRNDPKKVAAIENAARAYLNGEYQTHTAAARAYLEEFYGKILPVDKTDRIQYLAKRIKNKCEQLKIS